MGISTFTPNLLMYLVFLAVGRKIHLRSSILFPELELRDQSQYKTAVPPYMGIRDARAFYESEGHACLSNNQ